VLLTKDCHQIISLIHHRPVPFKVAIRITGVLPHNHSCLVSDKRHPVPALFCLQRQGHHSIYLFLFWLILHFQQDFGGPRTHTQGTLKKAADAFFVQEKELILGFTM